MITMMHGLYGACRSWCSSQNITFNVVMCRMVVPDGRVCWIAVGPQRSGDKIEQEEGEQSEMG